MLLYSTQFAFLQVPSKFLVIILIWKQPDSRQDHYAEPEYVRHENAKSATKRKSIMQDTSQSEISESYFLCQLQCWQ